jgi:hypothetical protein
MVVLVLGAVAKMIPACPSPYLLYLPPLPRSHSLIWIQPPLDHTSHVDTHSVFGNRSRQRRNQCRRCLAPLGVVVLHRRCRRRLPPGQSRALRHGRRDVRMNRRPGRTSSSSCRGTSGLSGGGTLP